VVVPALLDEAKACLKASIASVKSLQSRLFDGDGSPTLKLFKSVDCIGDELAKPSTTSKLGGSAELGDQKGGHPTVTDDHPYV
jgi:hypothetical protein